MSEFTVGPGGEFSSLTAAARQVVSGDTVVVLDGVYRELLICRTPNVTWRAAPGAKPVIDGGWNGAEVEGYVNQIAINADGVTVDGLTVVNSPGRGISIGASGVTVRNCRFENCYHGGLVANGTAAPGRFITGLLIENNVFAKLSQSWVTEKRPSNVAGSFIFVRVRDSVARGNVICDGFGEGLNIDRDTEGCLYEGNTVISTNHAGCYFCRSIGNTVRGNTFIHTLEEQYRGSRGAFPAAVVFGDESASASFGPQSGNEFTGNVVVSWGRLLEVRNGSNYDTLLTDTLIAGNTFIAGPETTEGIVIAAHPSGPHDCEFRDNVIDMNAAKVTAPIGSGAFGVKCHHNAWSEEPPKGMQGAGDIYGDLGLYDPGEPVTRAPGATVTTYDADNYRPAAGSPLTGAASDGTTIGALEPAGVVEPEPTDPPVPDYDWVIAALEGNLEKLEAAGLAIGAAVIDTHELIDLLKSAAG